VPWTQRAVSLSTFARFHPEPDGPLISHRFSTVCMADTSLVLAAGELVEQGNPRGVVEGRRTPCLTLRPGGGLIGDSYPVNPTNMTTRAPITARTNTSPALGPCYYTIHPPKQKDYWSERKAITNFICDVREHLLDKPLPLAFV